ncbi:hypothetical protein [Photorhabdus africana]|uniref:hypothetical protein n=1 Tax=Photorhabdus africana TaxID=3097554 RepID=UPI002B405F49|nr:hypothetical protein [Photorhabdus sp. CRI-LC]
MKDNGYNIPLFIWYNDNINPKYRHTGVINTPFSNSDNYYLISDWLGIYHKSPEYCRSPLSNCFKSQKEPTVIDGNKNLIKYNDLPDEKNIKIQTSDFQMFKLIILGINSNK